VGTREKHVSKLAVFAGASLALIIATAIGVLAGSVLCSHYINVKHLHYVAGVGFILVGMWTLYKSSP